MKPYVAYRQDACAACSTRSVTHLSLLVATALLLVFVLLSLFPFRAFASSYSCPSVNIDVTVNSDGSISVTETREFEFNGDFTAVWWTFDELPSEECEVSIDGASISTSDEVSAEDEDNQATTQALEEVTFESSWRESGGPDTASYSFDEEESTVYVFFEASDTSVTVMLSYTITNFVQVYNDVAELYWQCIGSGWSADSKHVNVTLRLPASGSVDTSSDDATVRAWVHGVLDSTVAIQDDGTVTLAIPSVSAGDYAEVRVVFPSDWMSSVASSASIRHTSDYLDSVLEEETLLANQSNVDRLYALALIVGCLLCSVGAIAWALVTFIRHGKEHKPKFQDTYWRDAPAADLHPSIIGRMWRWGAEKQRCLTATLMYLSHKGALRIDAGCYQVPDDSGSPKTVHDYYITRLFGWQDKVADSPIDAKAIEVLFDTIAQGADSLWFGTVSQYAQEHPEQFMSLMSEWEDVVITETNRHNFFESRSLHYQGWMIGLGVFGLVVGLIGVFGFGNFIPLAAFAPAAVVLIVVSMLMNRRSTEAVEIDAKCKALLRWLKDLDTLDEQLPTDAKTWGNVMVYAYVLGAPQEFIGSLQAKLPSVMSDPECASVCFWMTQRRCGIDTEEVMESPAETFASMQANISLLAKNAVATTDSANPVNASESSDTKSDEGEMQTACT